MVSLITSTAAAPSLSGQALPAVTVPSGRNTGLRLARPSIVTPARGPSSRDTTVPSGSVMGVISSANQPLSTLATARSCESLPHSSISSRVTPVYCTTFSAVWPIAM